MKATSRWVLAMISIVTALLLALPASALAQPASSRDVLTALTGAINRGDGAAALALFAADATVDSAAPEPATATGTAEIRAWLESIVLDRPVIALGEFGATSAVRAVSAAQVSIDSWRNAGFAPVDATLDVTVDGGRIQSLAISIAPETSSQIAQARASMATVKLFFDHLNSGEIHAASALLTEDVIIYGALGDQVAGKPAAIAYYTRLISQNIRLDPAGQWVAGSDRVIALYGLGVESLRSAGVESADTIGEFYLREGKISIISARFTPHSQQAVLAALGQ